MAEPSTKSSCMNYLHRKTREEFQETLCLVFSCLAGVLRKSCNHSPMLCPVKILMKNDPGYMANLMALALVERERLLYGNWKIKAAAGLMFKRFFRTFLESDIRYLDLSTTL